ncbi:MAG: bifunctional folylpolyglutamate synthase/dihydrofolate synthase [Sphingobacteriales bacterium]|nr:bifunctional folylpolyglutamate synthase/dihydrofolate synthase [Sphingobacteriales bacterium]
MNYQQAIDYLFDRLPMFSRVGPAAFKKDLTNTLALCEHLGNPQQKFKSIHIAGTNGKGSVSHMLAAILQTQGYKTGLYTSPHLKDFRERIKVNGEVVSEDFVIDFTGEIRPLIEKTEPSFFEITVAMAFEYFAQQKVDIAVIEVGLGGRLDSTNVIIPELSVITNIGWDHMNMLGDSLEKIAFEKAGIIKENIPVVVGVALPETLPVFQKIAEEINAPLSIAADKRQLADWHWQKPARQSHSGGHELLVEVAEKHHTDHKTYHLDLPGLYQAKNLLTVLEVCSQLRAKGWKMDEENISKALKQVKKLTGLHGRWEIVHHSPLVVLDVAHNADGIKQVVQQVELTDHKNLHVIIGLVKDKDPEWVLELLPKEASYYFTKAQIPRALSENELQKKAARYGLRGKTFSNVNTALYSAAVNAHKDDMILICGSIFLVGELSLNSVKSIWGKEELSGGFWSLIETIGSIG